MTKTAESSLDDLTPHQLVDEIKQITEQYSREVTTSRRTWPRSVRERVLALARMGVPRSRIAKLCALPSATVFNWCRPVSGKKLRPQSRFLALPVQPEVSHSSATVGIGNSSSIPTVVTGIQLLLPGGIEVRGLTSVDQVLALYRGCLA